MSRDSCVALVHWDLMYAPPPPANKLILAKRGSVKNNLGLIHILRMLMYSSEIWHMHAMNCPASEYAIYKTMQSIDCCCLATEICEITSCVHDGK